VGEQVGHATFPSPCSWPRVRQHRAAPSPLRQAKGQTRLMRHKERSSSRFNMGHGLLWGRPNHTGKLGNPASGLEPVVSGGCPGRAVGGGRSIGTSGRSWAANGGVWPITVSTSPSRHHGGADAGPVHSSPATPARGLGIQPPHGAARPPRWRSPDHAGTE
jgi:hypothetical protein